MAIVRMTRDQIAALHRAGARHRALDAAPATPSRDDPDALPLTSEELARGVAGRRVRLARERAALSVDAFAERHGLAAKLVRDLEDGRLLPDEALHRHIRAIEQEAGATNAETVHGLR